MPERRLLEAGSDPVIRSVALAAPGYPPGLRDLPDPPPCVFLRGGDLPPVRGAIAMVGSRAASDYGRERARRIAADLARMGFVIVSGLARGIDAAAHRGALDAGGRTVAVLPGGLDAITPRHHRALAEQVAARGALLSEWAHGDPRGRHVFVQRNRLIAALASATVVVEAAIVSGALSTAAAARRLGRAVLAVPGDVDRVTAQGCHALIRGGAALCEQASDVLTAIGRPDAKRVADETTNAPTSVRTTGMETGPAETPEARVLAALDRVPRTVETLAAAATLSVPETLAALLALTWAGAAEARPGQRWTRSDA